MTAHIGLYLVWTLAHLTALIITASCIIDGNHGGAILAGITWILILGGGVAYQVAT